jgi:hypothetical protein
LFEPNFSTRLAEKKCLELATQQNFTHDGQIDLLISFSVHFVETFSTD